MASYLGGTQVLSPVLGKHFTNMDVFGRVMYSEMGAEDESTTIVDDKLKVFLRIKPWDVRCVDDTINNSNYCVDGKSLITKSTNQKHEEVNSTFHFTDVFLPSTSQEVIYETVVKRNLKNFLLGDSSLVFAYGTSNSGKSYTMQGTGSEPGIIPRVLYTIFNSISGYEDISGKYYPDRSSTVLILDDIQIANNKTYKKNLLSQFAKESRKQKRNLRLDMNDSIRCTSHESMEDSLQAMSKIDLSINDGSLYSVWLSFAEIYNETLYDLLVDAHEQQPLNLSEDADKNNFIKGLKHINVHSWLEAYELYRYGKNNLHISQTVLNKKSSRSHCLLTIKVVLRDVNNQDMYSNCSSFTICDLAGSERQKRAGTAGTMRCKEAQNINASLLVLNRCIESMRKNQKIKGSLRIPFRESKLTRLFKNFLSGEGSVTMVANMSQDPTLFYETQQVLKMTADAYKIKIISNAPKNALKEMKLKLKELDKQQMEYQHESVPNQLINKNPVAICRHCGEYKRIIANLKKNLASTEEALEHETCQRRQLEQSKTSETNLTEIYRTNYEKIEVRYDCYKKRADKELFESQKQILQLQSKIDGYVETLQNALGCNDYSAKALINTACCRIQLLEKMNVECQKQFDDLKENYIKVVNVDYEALLKENAELKGRVSYLEEKIEKCDILMGIDLNTEYEQIPKAEEKEDLTCSFAGNTTLCMKKTTMVKSKEDEDLSLRNFSSTSEQNITPMNESDGNLTYGLSDPDISRNLLSLKNTHTFISSEPCLGVTQIIGKLSLEEIQENKNVNIQELVEKNSDDASSNVEELVEESCENLNLSLEKNQDNENLHVEERLAEIQDNLNLEENQGENLNLEDIQNYSKRHSNSSPSPVSSPKTPATVIKSKKKLMTKRAVHLGEDFVPQETTERVVIPSPGSILSSLRPRKKK